MNTNEPLIERRAIAVLGMHRSGTSALTGAMEIVGCATPANQIAGGVQNPKGFFEARLVARLNDRLLEFAGSSWDDWRSMPEDWADDPAVLECTQEGQDLILAEFGTPPVLALKDPRICRLFPYWSRVLNLSGAVPMALLTHRHPMAVAQSLRHRNGHRLERGLLLWLTHALNAEFHSRGHPRAFVSYDMLLTDPVQTLLQIEQQFGVPFPKRPEACASKINKFINADLRHHAPSEEISLPHIIQVAFDIFENWAVHGETEYGRKTLDRLRRLLRLTDAHVPETPEAVETHSENIHLLLTFLLGPAGQAEEVTGKMQKLRKSDLVDLNHTLTQGNAILHEEIRQIEETLALKSADVDQFRTAIETRDLELGTLAKLLQLAEARAEKLDEKLTDSIQAGRTAGDTMQSILEEKKHLLEKHLQLKKQAEETARELEALAQEKDRLASENTELHALVYRVENERRAIAHSTIWRASYPLRKMVNLLTRRGD